MSRFAFIACALLFLPAPLLAQIVFEDAPTKLVPAKPAISRSDWDKIECRAEDVLGSRLERHKVCLTKFQWWLFEHEEREEIQRWQIIGSATNG